MTEDGAQRFDKGSSSCTLPHLDAYWFGRCGALPHPELLLQARRRCRVLEHQPLVWEDVVVGLLRHQRPLVEAAQDELELAGIGVDVTDGEDARNARLEGGGVHRDEVLLEIQSPIGDRAEL